MSIVRRPGSWTEQRWCLCASEIDGALSVVKEAAMMRTGAGVPSPLLYCRAIIAKDYIHPLFSKGCTTLTYNCPQAFPNVKLKTIIIYSSNNYMQPGRSQPCWSGLPPHSFPALQELILLSAKLLNSDTEAEGKGGGGRRKEGEFSQQSHYIQPLKVLWGWILAHSPMLENTSGFNYIRWNIIIMLYPCSSLHCVGALSLVFILVKGKDTALDNLNWCSQLKQCISWQHKHWDINIKSI